MSVEYLGESCYSASRRLANLVYIDSSVHAKIVVKKRTLLTNPTVHVLGFS